MSNKWCMLIQFIAIVLLLSAVIYYRSASLQSSTSLQTVYRDYESQQTKWNVETKRLQSEIESLTTNQVSPQNGQSSSSSKSHNKDKDDWNDVDEQWIRDLQRNDRRFLQLQYGSGPLHILIETAMGEIELETAALRSMPHSIRYFVSLIESGFWNGCHFFRNADHVIQANCHQRNEDNAFAITQQDEQHHAERLKETGEIVFQEYDDTLPWLHQKYSIGIAGRPGGPDFYVNLVDNKRNHGPGGQGPKPDPCFAHIVRGQHVIDEIHRMEHDGSSMKVLKEW
eukprot:CAMPEP_0202720318 /NCGR_PEP_ID=MMETSP1385-20130828/138949_1 /ASSEMBLY_ACC=CAM_ASM_000861 /TAXON_ID=933848 /ORGANISM="Elphidium margaritaceum" /LENGTH=282 /DNA_ID=CAMNT_0049383977 /DNA_START=61 /DNA_END=906 /DNA_ORIENTATION=+